jgi:hypothetical protein
VLPKNIQDHLKQYRLKKNLGIFTQKTTEMFSPKNINFTSRYEDIYVTPNELIDRNFTKNEINIIKSDPTYFKLNKSPFKNTAVLQNKTLVEILKEEEKLKEQLKRKKTLKGISPPAFLRKATKLINEKESKLHMPNIKDEKSSSLLKKDSYNNSSNNILSHKGNSVNTSVMLKLDSQIELKEKYHPESSNTINNENILIPELTHLNFSKLDFFTKMKIYSEKRMLLTRINSEKLKKNKDKVNVVKKLVRLKKIRQMEENILTNQYLTEIKDNYTTRYLNFK